MSHCHLFIVICHIYFYINILLLIYSKVVMLIFVSLASPWPPQRLFVFF